MFRFESMSVMLRSDGSAKCQEVRASLQAEGGLMDLAWEIDRIRGLTVKSSQRCLSSV
jgi:hypothetical protein